MFHITNYIFQIINKLNEFFKLQNIPDVACFNAIETLHIDPVKKNKVQNEKVIKV